MDREACRLNLASCRADDSASSGGIPTEFFAQYLLIRILGGAGGAQKRDQRVRALRAEIRRAIRIPLVGMVEPHRSVTTPSSASADLPAGWDTVEGFGQIQMVWRL
jgi:hypothetical protein